MAFIHSIRGSIAFIVLYIKENNWYCNHYFDIMKLFGACESAHYSFLLKHDIGWIELDYNIKRIISHTFDSKNSLDKEKWARLLSCLCVTLSKVCLNVTQKLRISEKNLVCYSKNTHIKQNWCAKTFSNETLILFLTSFQTVKKSIQYFI